MKLLFSIIICILLSATGGVQGQTLLKTTWKEVDIEIVNDPNVKSADTYFKGTSKIVIVFLKNGGRRKYKFIQGDDILYSVYYSEPTEEETVKKFNETLANGDYEETEYKFSYKKRGTRNSFFGLDKDDFGRVWYGWEQIPI